MKKLSEFEIGERGIIRAVSGEGRIRRRLFDMGVTPGADVVLKKRAPLGDPVEITIRGYELSLRKSEADCVDMEVIYEEIRTGGQPEQRQDDVIQRFDGRNGSRRELARRNRRQKRGRL